MEKNSQNIISLDSKYIAKAVGICCKAKADIVTEDEKETGSRALLNLGHTFGHAIETAVGYGKLLHGETVAMGIVMAADRSKRWGWLAPIDAIKIRRVLEENYGLPVEPPAGITVEQYLDLMLSDKKAEFGKKNMNCELDIRSGLKGNVFEKKKHFFPTAVGTKRLIS